MGDLTPITREEYFLARMAGEDVTMPEPITREEEYMKGIAAQIEAGSTELPAVTDVDEGKILAVNASGKWDKADAPTELPEVSASDNGDVLTVVEGAWAKAAKDDSVVIFPAKNIGSGATVQISLLDDKTFNDVENAILAGKHPIIKLSPTYELGFVGSYGSKRYFASVTPNSSGDIIYYRRIGYDASTELSSKSKVINEKILTTT